jgi:hypothetical protein
VRKREGTDVKFVVAVLLLLYVFLCIYVGEHPGTARVPDPVSAPHFAAVTSEYAGGEA